MKFLTIYYTNGHEEDYSIALNPKIENGLQMQHFHQFMSDGVLKLINTNSEIVLIPIVSIKKVVIKLEDSFNQNRELPGFVRVEPIPKDQMK